VSAYRKNACKPEKNFKKSVWSLGEIAEMTKGGSLPADNSPASARFFLSQNVKKQEPTP
jgi:hypothetical protein